MKPQIFPVVLVALAFPVYADAPKLKNTGPIIFLADNLDEKDQLGWCIDTQGRGLSDAIQAHSCKPDSSDIRNRDVLFDFDQSSGRIEHAEYAGLCLTVNEAGASTALGLIDCVAGSAAQTFTYSEDMGAIHPLGDTSLCLAVAAESRSAGPYMSRGLGIEPCADVEEALRRWIILAAE